MASNPYYLRDVSEGGGPVSTTASPHTSLLLYGDFGTGKTRAAYTFPSPLGISLDKGESALSDDVPRERFFYQKPIFRQLLALINDARDGVGPWFGVGGKYADRQTLVIDTGSELSDFMIYELMALERPTDKGGQVISWAPEEKAPIWDHYALLTSRMEAIGRALRDLKETRMNVVMTCLAQTEQDKSGNAVVGYPMLTGKTRSKIAAWFDEVYYMAKEKAGVSGAKYIAYPYDFGLFKCKSRKYDLVKPIENLSYDNVLKAAAERAASKSQIPAIGSTGGPTVAQR